MTFKVMIVDKSERLSLGLRLSLEGESDIEVAGEFDTAASAVTQVAQVEPLMVLPSMSLPDLCGFKVCLQMLDEAPSTSVVMLSEQLADQEIAAPMMVGAVGLLRKDGSQCDLSFRRSQWPGRAAPYRASGPAYHQTRSVQQ